MSDKTVTMSRELALFESILGKNPEAYLHEPVYQVTESEVLEFARQIAAPVVERRSVGHISPKPPAPVAVDIDERAEFEAEMLRQNPEADLELNSNDNYMNFYLECAWNGWQQRACLDKVKELNQC